MAFTKAEIVRRCRDRKRGIDIPRMPPGVKKGYKQTPEHIQKRQRFGEEHHSYKGDDVGYKSARSRAERGYPCRPCELCGNTKAERHHKDGNTRNNSPENIQFVCRRCHMKVDGRYDRFIEIARENQPKAVACRWL